MASPLPLLLVGGGALLLLGGKKRKKRSSSKSTPSVSDTGGQAELPEIIEDEDLDKPTTKPIPDPAPPGADLPPALPSEPLEPSEPYGKPQIGPSGVGSCANSIYTRDPVYMTPDILTANDALSLFPEEGYFFYMRRDLQKEVYDYMLERFSAMNNGQEVRTVASVVLRESLKNFNSECKWENPVDTLSEPERLVWESGQRLAIMAQATVGITDPDFTSLFQTGQRFTITRKSLGDPDPGFMGAASKATLPGRRVEILATDKSQANAEHIFGEVLKLTGPNGEPNLFEVRILDTFQGSDVSPRLRTKHGFKVGSNAYFSQQGPTGIFRIYPEGMQ